MVEEKTIYNLSHIANIINGVYSLILISIPLIISLWFNVLEKSFGLILFFFIINWIKCN